MGLGVLCARNTCLSLAFLVFLISPQATMAAQQLLAVPGFSAQAIGEPLCGENGETVLVRVSAADKSAFEDDKAGLNDFLPWMMTAVTSHCPDANRVNLEGYSGAERLFAGHLKKSNDWALETDARPRRKRG